MRLKSMICILGTALCLYGCNKSDGHDSHAHELEAHDHVAEGADHDHDHGEEASNPDEIQLAPSMALRLGVEADTLRPAPMSAAIRTSGVISPSAGGMAVVVAPKSGTVTLASGIAPGAGVKRGRQIAVLDAAAVAGGDQNAQARAALDAAKRELDRITPLYNDKIVTASAYNAALQAYEEARAAWSSGAQSGVATAPISGVISAVDAPTGTFVEAGAPIATIVADGELTLTAQVPVSQARVAPTLTDARMVAADGTALTVSQAGGRRLSSGATEVRGAYIPVTFSFKNDGSFVPGQSVEVYLLGAPRQGVLSVPRSALVEQQGRYFVYEKVDDECYVKLPVAIGQSDGERVEILSGLTPGQFIVMSGAMAVRLAESASVAPEGHSHNH